MKEAIDELKRLRSILSGITGFEDDDQEYIEDARKSVDRIIEALAEQEPVATVAEVHMSRYTIEWTNGPLPEGTELYTSPQAQRVPLTDELNQIEKDLSFHGLTLVKTATGYAVLKLGQITAHAKGDA